MYVYALSLEENRFYVGKTKSVNRRLVQHVRGSAQWTKIYKPKSIIQVMEGDKNEELAMTLDLMAEHGIENVRGSSFCEVKLTKQKINFIKDLIHGRNDHCFACGKVGHFKNECPEIVSQQNSFTLGDNNNSCDVPHGEFSNGRYGKKTRMSSRQCVPRQSMHESPSSCSSQSPSFSSPLAQVSNISNQSCSSLPSQLSTVSNQSCTIQKVTISSPKVSPLTICTTPVTQRISTQFSTQPNVKDSPSNVSPLVHHASYSSQRRKRPSCNKDIICSRCGRETHAQENCYAVKDIHRRTISRKKPYARPYEKRKSPTPFDFKGIV